MAVIDRVGPHVLLGMIFSVTCILGIDVRILQGQEKHRLASEQAVEYSSHPELIAEAEAKFISYLNAREEFPSCHAVLVRGRNAVLNTTKGMSDVENTFINVRDEQRIGNPGETTKHLYTAAGRRVIASQAVEPSVNTRWDQFLRVGSDTYARVGYEKSWDKLNKVETESTDKEAREHKPRSNLDFFILPICDRGSLSGRSVSRSLLPLFASKGQVVRAAKTKHQIYGVWRFDHWPNAIVVLAFDHRVDDMPVRAEWRFGYGEDVDQVLSKGHMHSLCETQWKEVEHEDRKIFVPAAIKLNYVASKTKDMEEIDLHIQWKFGEEVLKAIPEPTDEHWTKRTETLFQTDLSLSFDEYAEQMGLARE